MTTRELGRFWAKVEPHEGGCWEWTAAVNSMGYANLRIGSRTAYAHRLAYEHFVGPIPEGLEIDHLCRNPACVNPEHMEVVTHRENLLRGAGGRHRTSCRRGHPYDEHNTGWRKRASGLQRYCKECNAAYCHEWRRRHAL